jgi:hypothetical protein
MALLPLVPRPGKRAMQESKAASSQKKKDVKVEVKDLAVRLPYYVQG